MPGKGMDRQSAAFLVAVRHFPANGEDIEALIRRDGSFSDMCEELAEAEVVLSQIGHFPATERESRASECNGWIDRLTNEIAEAIRQSNVIRLGQHGHRQGH